MSAKITGLVLERFPAHTSTNFAVALVLADAADHDGSNVYPSVARIALLARVSERSVQSCIAEFTKAGFLHLVKRGGGRSNPSRYKIDVDWLQAQHSVLENKKGAEGSPFLKTTQTLQKPCENPAKASSKGCKNPAKLLHPTQDPIYPDTHDPVGGGGAVIEDLVEACLSAAGDSVRDKSAYASAIRRNVMKRGITAQDRELLVNWRSKQAHAAVAKKLPPPGKYLLKDGSTLFISEKAAADIKTPEGEYMSYHIADIEQMLRNKKITIASL